MSAQSPTRAPICQAAKNHVEFKRYMQEYATERRDYTATRTATQCIEESRGYVVLRPCFVHAAPTASVPIGRSQGVVLCWQTQVRPIQRVPDLDKQEIKPNGVVDMEQEIKSPKTVWENGDTKPSAAYENSQDTKSSTTVGNEGDTKSSAAFEKKDGTKLGGEDWEMVEEVGRMGGGHSWRGR